MVSELVMAWQVTEQDVQSALAAHGVSVDLDAAARALPFLDRNAIARCALYGDEIDTQSAHAENEIISQLTDQVSSFAARHCKTDLRSLAGDARTNMWRQWANDALCVG